MKIFTKSAELSAHISTLKSDAKKIGFVPTMGALHAGHVSLVERSKMECDFTIVSIFVNPTQFNNPADFEKYPIRTEDDLTLLTDLHVDFVFLPNKEEIYTENFKIPNFSIGELNNIMEGKFRPGHFEGVMQVVYRFFEIIQPTKAYFGLKDFQQVAVIQKMTQVLNLEVEIIPCVTVREQDGLALSSRNLRLSEGQRFEALFIYQSLILAENLSQKLTPKEVKNQIEQLYLESTLKLEYVEIIDSKTFEILNEKWSEESIVCIVAYVGEIRLIDNLAIHF
ncbi:MAG: pantoate--beta-alanine ligase [Flavobacteriia bacterium]